MATSTIKPTGGSYASLSAWWAAKGSGADFVTAASGEIAECYTFTGGLDDVVNISGATTNATYFATITVASGNRHLGIPLSAFYLTKNTGGTPLTVGQNYTRVEYLDVYQAQAGGANVNAVTVSGTNVTLEWCLARTDATGASSRAYQRANDTVFTSCLGYNSKTAFWDGSAGAPTYYHCVAAGCGTGFASGGGGALYIDCVAYNNTTNWSVTSPSASSDYNATSSATNDAPGTHNVTGVASGDFNAAASDDYHLSGTGSALYHAGTTISGVTTDIDGDSYDATTPSIGFDEVVSGGGGISGSGSLASSDAAVAGTGTSASVGSGTLAAQDASISGTGAVGTVIVGTGSLAASDAAIAGAGITESAGTGSLVAQDAAASGTGVSASEGSGALTAQDSTISGAGVIGSIVTGTGALVASDASVSGTGTSESTGSGALASADASISGTGTLVGFITGAGALVCQDATISGAGASESAGTGTLTAADAQVTGAGAAAWVGSGSLVCSDAFMAGAGISESTGSGSLAAGGASISGTGTLVTGGVRIGDLLYPQLAGYADLSTLVGTRIYPNVAPRGVAKPYVVWQVISTDPATDLDGSGGLTYHRIQITAFAKDPTSARTVMNAVMAAMAAAVPVSSQTGFRSLVVEPGVRSAGFEFDTKLYGKRCDFDVKMTPILL